MTMNDDACRRALNATLSRDPDARHRMLLLYQLLVVRLGSEVSDTAILDAPARLAPYLLQLMSGN